MIKYNHTCTCMMLWIEKLCLYNSPVRNVLGRLSFGYPNRVVQVFWERNLKYSKVCGVPKLKRFSHFVLPHKIHQ